MSTKRHGLSIGFERINNEIFLTLKAVGNLTHEDYQKINPMVDSALDGVKDPELKVLFDGTELEGWEMRAAWDDFRFGLKHGNEFTKIAFYGNKNWQELAVKISKWFVSGQVKYFEDVQSALKWLQE